MIGDEEVFIIEDLNDLKEVLSITQSFDGILKYKIDFFNNIFYPLYKSKLEPNAKGDRKKKSGLPLLQGCFVIPIRKIQEKT